MLKSSVSSAPGKRVARRKQPTVKPRRIDFSDIPEISNAQLRVMRRVGRPPLGETARRLIALRIDPRVLKAVKREAGERDIGYQTLINDILARHAKHVT